ncbi:MAG: hypothetical protein J6B77_09330 [Clostridia bacterium]|nr:hypothetical protein [Clostridia bacterium]
MEKKMFPRYPIGNPRRKWRQDNFILQATYPGVKDLKLKTPVTPWQLEKTRRAVETAADAGFTVVGTTWASKAAIMEVVRTAERLGLRVFYGDFMRFTGMGFSKTLPKHEPEAIIDVIRELKNWKSIIGFITYDEPINEEQRKITREMQDIVERECPDMIPLTVTAAGKERMVKMAEEVDPPYAYFDFYPLGNTRQMLQPEDQLDHSKLWYLLELNRRISQKTGAPVAFAYQGQELFYHPLFDRYTFAASRMMANAALLYGAKLLLNYIEFNGFINSETGGRGPAFEEQKALNRSISVLGNTLMALESVRVIHDESVSAKDVEEWEDYRYTMEDSELLTGALDHRISISELADAYGHRYLMVLNRDYRTEKHYRLICKEPSRVYRVDEETGLERLAYEGDEITGCLQPGCVALYRIQSLFEEPYLVEYYLEKDEGL